jgi:phosphonate metabolism-associated iron-containing alcohol dehydrogenase
MKTVSTKTYQYSMPTRIEFGEGVLSRLADIIGPGEGPIMIISNRSMGRLGVIDRVRELLGSDRIIVFDLVSPNPTLELIDEVVEVTRSEKCRAVVGIGGGSAMDVAKCTAILQLNPHGISAYLTQEESLERPGVPFIAVPTTAGSGSEVTPFATVWDMRAHRKRSLEHRWMFPTTALVDPTLTLTLPPYQTAATGMDALTQAIEAYWSKRSQPISDMYALRAVREVFENLEDACVGGGMPARSAMAHASLLAGLAFSNTKTTICHSLSYPITAHFGVSHGQAVSITLPSFLLWNADGISAKLPALLQAIGSTCPEDAADRIRQLMERIGLATDFHTLGLEKKDVDLVLAEGFYADRADNNPKPVGVEDARSILYDIL